MNVGGGSSGGMIEDSVSLAEGVGTPDVGGVIFPHSLSFSSHVRSIFVGILGQCNISTSKC